MIKQLLFVSIFVLAKCIFLAHEMIPHHPYEGHVCFAHASCGGHEAPYEQENPAPENKAEACCPLADTRIIAPSSHSFSLVCPVFTHPPSEKDSPAILFFHTWPDSSWMPGFSLWKNPGKTPFTSGRHYSATGLRTPPLG